MFKEDKKLSTVYEINDFLSLKLLENGRTQILINNKPIMLCTYLLINIPVDQIEDYDEINSIDEAEEHLNHEMHGRFNYQIPAETEFWGHCSNLEAWAENNYDTRILHRNLAFPLLKKLTNAGDPLAKRVFKEEIAKRIQSGYPSVINYLILSGYLIDFTKEELDTLVSLLSESLKEKFWILMGKSYSSQGYYRNALEYLEKGIKFNPNSEVLWQEMGRCYENLKNYKKAIEAYKITISLNPRDAKNHVDLGMCYLHLDLHNKALKSLKKASYMRFQNKQDYLSLLDAYNYFSLKFIESGNYSRAQQILQKARTIHPDYPPTWLNLGALYLKKGNKEEALYAFSRALKGNMEGASTWISYHNEFSKAYSFDIKKILQLLSQYNEFKEIYWDYLYETDYEDEWYYYYSEDEEFLDKIGDGFEEIFYDALVDNLKTVRRLKSKPTRLGGKRKEPYQS